MNFKSLYKINEPICRFDFFKIVTALIIFQLAGAGLSILVYKLWCDTPIQFLVLFFMYVILIQIPVLYVYFITSTQRIWDIIRKYPLCIWINIPLVILSVFFAPLFIVSIIILILAGGRRNKGTDVT